MALSGLPGLAWSLEKTWNGSHASAATVPVIVSAANGATLSRCFDEYIAKAMDCGLDKFYVYGRVDAGWNHFTSLQFDNGGDNLDVDFDFPTPENLPAQWDDRDAARLGIGATCIRATWDAEAAGRHTRQRWNSVAFLDTRCDGRAPGFDLRGATKLSGYIRSDTPGMTVQLSVGRDEDECGQCVIRQQKDNGLKVSDGWLTLSARDRWYPFEIDLRGKDLSCLRGGFGFAVASDRPHGGDRFCTFYLANIAFDKTTPLSTLRLIPSYLPHKTLDEEVASTRNVCYVYDNALAIIALVSRGQADDITRARLLADALIYCQEHDPHPYFDEESGSAKRDDRLRNAYMSGAIPFHGNPSAGEAARLPGWWDSSIGKYDEDWSHLSSHAGNAAWAIIALLTVFDHVRSHDGAAEAEPYRRSAARLGRWVVDNCRPVGHCRPDATDGFTGGTEGMLPGAQGAIPWKSTEMNLDLVAAFTRLYNTGQLSCEPNWRDCALSAYRFVKSMFAPDASIGSAKDPAKRDVDPWDGAFPHFCMGTRINPRTGVVERNWQARPMDVNSWAVLVLCTGDEDAIASIPWIENRCVVKQDSLSGFSFHCDKVLAKSWDQPIPKDEIERATSIGPEGIWFEGTGQMVVVYKARGNSDAAEPYLASLRRVQEDDLGGPGVIASTIDGLTTGVDLATIDKAGRQRYVPWLYYRQRHLGATCWYVFAELGINPYWGTRADDGPERTVFDRLEGKPTQVRH